MFKTPTSNKADLIDIKWKFYIQRVDKCATVAWQKNDLYCQDMYWKYLALKETINTMNLRE
jgi:hypothetical protein